MLPVSVSEIDDVILMEAKVRMTVSVMATTYSREECSSGGGVWQR